MAHDILRFEGLPFWQGTCAEYRKPEVLPFELSLDPRGFWRQSTSSELRREIASIYARSDYTFITPPPGSSAWANQLGEEKLSALLSCCPSLDGLDILEIGSGSLYVARNLTRRFSINSYVSVDPALAEPSFDNVEVLREFFPSSAINNRKFDLIIAFSCLEHLEDPVEFLKACREFLKPDAAGVFLVFPDVGESLRQGDLGILVHEHLSYFDEAGVHNILMSTGFSATWLSSRHGSFSLLARTGGSEAARKVPVAEQGVVTAYQRNIQGLRDQILAQLDRGQKVVFHGANPNLNNFLWLAGLTGDHRISVYDNDLSKHGRYLPTCASPIKTPEAPEYAAADHAYVAAINYLLPIRTTMMDRGIPADRIYPLLLPQEA